MVKARIVPAGAQPLAVKFNNPCGNMTPAGALPAGGELGPPVSGMKAAVVKWQPAPPPVKLTVALPVPVAVAPVNEVILGLMNPILSTELSVNHRLPSGPEVIV